MKYNKELKLQALRLSDEIGLKAAAEELGVNYHTLSGWRSVRKACKEYMGLDRGKCVIPACPKDRQIEELKAELKDSNDVIKGVVSYFIQTERKDEVKHG